MTFNMKSRPRPTYRCRHRYRSWIWAFYDRWRDSARQPVLVPNLQNWRTPLIYSIVAGAFRNGLKDPNSDFGRLISSDSSTMRRNLVDFVQ